MDRTCLFIVCIVVVFLVTSELTVRATPVKDVHKSKRSLDEDVQLPLRGGGRRNQRQSRVGQLNLHDLGSDGTIGSARRHSVGSMSRRNSVRNVRRHGRRRCTTRMRRLGRCRTGIRESARLDRVGNRRRHGRRRCTEYMRRLGRCSSG